MKHTKTKKCYGIKKGKLVNVYKHYIKNKKTKKNRCVVTTTKKYMKNKIYRGKVYRLKRTANKKLNKGKRRNKPRTRRRRRRIQRGGQGLRPYNVNPYNSDPKMPHPETTNLNSNIPRNYQTSNLKLEQGGGSVMQELAGTSDAQIGYYNLGNAFKNVGHVWNGDDLQVGADPLNHPAMDHVPQSVETVQDIGSIRDNASRNTIQ